MKILALLLAVVLPAIADGTDTRSRGDLLKDRQYRTNTDVNLFVDPLGSDSNACTSTGVAACLTIQGAVNKAPKFLRHRLTISVAAGTYSGFYISGFVTDVGVQSATAGIAVNGVLTNSVGLAAGVATGTATGGTAGSTSTFGTLSDTGQAWTVNDLRGRFIAILTGTGALQVQVIGSNTATALTIAGTWTSPVAGSTYAIQDSTSFINTCVAIPPIATQAPGTFTSAIRIQNNSDASTIVLRGLSVTAPGCTFGVGVADFSTVILNRMQFPSGGPTSRIVAGGQTIVDAVASTFASTVGTHLTAGALASSQASVLGGVGTSTSAPRGAGGTFRNSLFVNGGTGAFLSNYIGSTTLVGLEFININGTVIQTGGAIGNLQGLHLDCTAVATGVGIFVGSFGANPTSAVAPDHVDITDCATAFRLYNSASHLASANGITATGVTTYFDVRNGGLATFTGTPGGTVSGNEISLDNGAIASTFAAIPASTNCVASLTYKSRVCRD